MSCSPCGILRRRGATVLVAAALAVSLAAPARANDASAPTSDQAQPTFRTQPSCTPACVAQEALATALHEPIRIGSSHFRLAVGSSKWTIGWSLVF